MVFSSFEFLFIFMPLLLFFYFITPTRMRQIRNLILLLFSLFFYAWGGISFLRHIIFSITLFFTCGCLAAKPHPPQVRKLGLYLAISGGIASLLYFKYSAFILNNLNGLGFELSVPEIVMPLGISFYTFQGMSYVADVYVDTVQVQKNPLQLALYLILFPQLVAGPIVRYATLEHELYTRHESLEEFAQGCIRFTFGLAKKMLLANPLGEITDGIFSLPVNEIPCALAWLGAFSYSGQIYLDFSAYSDMAIGLGLMFGFHFPENFNYPYISSSITEFWRRWHISLSSWFRDYVYIPLGGNKNGRSRQVCNLLVVWLLTGLWHGANWTFLVWGAWFAFLLIGEKFLWHNLWDRIPCIFKHLLTMILVIISWVFFRSETLTYALSFLNVMFSGENAIWNRESVYYLQQYTPELFCAVLAVTPLKSWLHNRLSHSQTFLARLILDWGPVTLAIVLLLLSYLKLVVGSFNPFIYFHF